MWENHWKKAQIIPDEPCRGCLSLSTIYKSGNKHVSIRARAMQREVRDTPAGSYCKSCFEALPACPTCSDEPTSHSEYPCLRCETIIDTAIQNSSGGRRESPTYRGWSLRYNGKGQDNGRTKSRRKAS